MTDTEHAAITETLSDLDFTPSCQTRSGCQKPAVTNLRVTAPCGCSCVWTLCEQHTIKAFTESLIRRWHCEKCNFSWVGCIKDLPKGMA
jgi:hypothetical protein